MKNKMGVSEVIHTLKKKPFLTSREISQIAGISERAIRRALKDLESDCSEKLKKKKLSKKEKDKKYNHNCPVNVYVYWLE